MTSLREQVMTALSNGAGLNELGITVDNIFAAESVDTPTLPFMVIRMGPLERGIYPANLQNCGLYVYDVPADYTNIDHILQAARSVLLGLIGTGSGGTWILGSDWFGDSQDLYDDTYQAIMRNGTFVITASGT